MVSPRSTSSSRRGSHGRAFTVRQAVRPGAGSARLVFHGGVSYRTSLLAFSPVVCVACNTSIHASSRAMSSAPEQRLFDIDLWFVGGCIL
jgi:hypothetical protein